MRRIPSIEPTTRTSVEFFHDEEAAKAHHAEMKAAGRKPKTRRLIDSRDPQGRPVYCWKVETHA